MFVYLIVLFFLRASLVLLALSKPNKFADSKKKKPSLTKTCVTISNSVQLQKAAF